MAAFDIVIITAWQCQMIATICWAVYEDLPEPTPPTMKDRTLAMVGNLRTEAMMGSPSNEENSTRID